MSANFTKIEYVWILSDFCDGEDLPRALKTHLFFSLPLLKKYIIDNISDSGTESEQEDCKAMKNLLSSFDDSLELNQGIDETNKWLYQVERFDFEEVKKQDLHLEKRFQKEMEKEGVNDMERKAIHNNLDISEAVIKKDTLPLWIKDVKKFESVLKSTSEVKDGVNMVDISSIGREYIDIVKKMIESKVPYNICGDTACEHNDLSCKTVQYQYPD